MMSSSFASTPSATHFDQAARDWDQRPLSQQLVAVVPYVLQARAWANTDSVLDFGAGTGLLATALAPHVGHVTALDTSAAMLQVLRDKGVAGIVTHQGDIHDGFHDGLPSRYHAIVSCMALHHVADIGTLLRTFAAALHPGGSVALVDLYQEDGSFHGDAQSNQAKGVQHWGFEPQALERLAQQAGLEAVTFTPIVSLTPKNGRSYPLFLLSAHKPA